VVFWPIFTVWVDGETAIEKSNVASTIKVPVVERVSPSTIPVTVNTYVPGGVESVVVSFRVAGVPGITFQVMPTPKPDTSVIFTETSS